MVHTRIAVIGAGPLVGVHHCNAIKVLEQEDVELACICQKRKDDIELANRLSCPMYTDAFEMASVEHLDGVVIAAPTHLHLPLAKALIEGAESRKERLHMDSIGLSAILVEKPICEDLRSALALIRLAETHGVQVLVGHQRRHSSLVQKARECVIKNNFGPLRGFTGEFALLKPQKYFEKDDPRLAWRTERGKGGPVLINLIHDVDLMRFITGHEISQIYAVTMRAARGHDVEDTGVLTMTMDHGAVGTFFFSDAVPSPWSYEFTTQENKKYPPVPGEGAKDCYHFMGAQQSLGFPSLRQYSYDSDIEHPGWDAPLTLTQSDVERTDPIRVQMSHFVRVCRCEEVPICSGMDAIESLAVIEAVHRSALTGVPVRPGDLLAEASGKQVGNEEHLLAVTTMKMRSTSLGIMSSTMGGFTAADLDGKRSASKGNTEDACSHSMLDF